MLNYIWAFMILIGIAFASFSGNMEAVSGAALDSAKEAVTLCVTMLGIMSMWTGELLKIICGKRMHREKSSLFLAVFISFRAL